MICCFQIFLRTHVLLCIWPSVHILYRLKCKVCCLNSGHCSGWYICHHTRPRDRRFIHKYYHIIHSVLYHIFRTFLYFGMIYSQKYNLFYYHILNGKPYRICMTCSLNINVHNYGIVYPHKRTEIIQDHALENFGV